MHIVCDHTCEVCINFKGQWAGFCALLVLHVHGHRGQIQAEVESASHMVLR
jgi:hypothetical protein